MLSCDVNYILILIFNSLPKLPEVVPSKDGKPLLDVSDSTSQIINYTYGHGVKVQ